MEEFDKKKALKTLEESRNSARRVVIIAIKEAKAVLEKEGIADPRAVIEVAKILYGIEVQTAQAKRQIEQIEITLKARAEAMKKAGKDGGPCAACKKHDIKTPSV